MTNVLISESRVFIYPWLLSTMKVYSFAIVLVMIVSFSVGFAVLGVISLFH